MSRETFFAARRVQVSAASCGCASRWRRPSRLASSTRHGIPCACSVPESLAMPAGGSHGLATGGKISSMPQTLLSGGEQNSAHLVVRRSDEPAEVRLFEGCHLPDRYRLQGIYLAATAIERGVVESHPLFFFKPQLQ